MIGARRVFTASCVIVITLADPGRALGQKQEFIAGLADFVAAAAGARSDDGPRLLAAIDRMSRAVGEWDQAIRQAEARSASSALAFQQRLVLAGLYIDRGRTQDALREIDAALQTESRRAELHQLQGVVLVASGRHDQAAAAFRQAWTLAPANATLAYRVHQSPAPPNDLNRAARALRAAYATIASGAAATARRGSAPPFVRVELVPDTAAAAPVFVPARYGAGLAAFHRADYSAAVTAWRLAAATDPLVIAPPASAAQGRSDDERPQLARAASLARAGRSAEAERVLLETIERIPGSALARWQLASLYESTHRVSEARRAVEAVAAAAIAGAGLVHDLAGRLARLEGDFTDALDAFTRAVAVRPNDPRAHKQLSRALLEQDRVGEAFAELVAALAIDPRDGEAHAAIGRIALDADRPREAVTALRRALALQPDRHEPRYALAAALRRLGDADAAARELEAFERAQRDDVAARRRGIAIAVRDEEAALQQQTAGSGQ